MEEKNLNYIGKYNLVEVTYGNNYTVNERKNSYKDIFKIDPELIVEKNDNVIIDWEEGFAIATITKIFSTEITQETIEASNKAKSWVIDKIDISKHKQRQEASERKIFILEELNRRKEEVQEIEIWKSLAKIDSKSKQLVKELEKLE